jgi:hypothetical protein
MKFKEKMTHNLKTLENRLKALEEQVYHKPIGEVCEVIKGSYVYQGTGPIVDWQEVDWQEFDKPRVYWKPFVRIEDAVNGYIKANGGWHKKEDVIFYRKDRENQRNRIEKRLLKQGD